MGRRFALIVLSLAAASVLSVGTLVIRMHETDHQRYWFLLWNLFLAWVPLIAASLAFALARRRVGAGVWALVVVWVLFFPNAPYMLTDFKHLHGSGSRLWYDALMLSSFAWTALMLGFTSLYLIHAIVGRRAGAAVGWVLVVGVLGMASFGVNLGRFPPQLNSWDVVARPRFAFSVAEHKIHSLLHEPKMVAALFALTAFLFVGYLVVYAFSALRLEPTEA